MPKCVLVVDDEHIVQEISKHTLQGIGYEVITAQDGLEAFEVLKQRIPDLILLDIQMPRMDGYTFIREKSKVPAYAGIPVVVLTSMGQTEPLFKRYGVKAYLLKPLKTQDLIDTIKAILPT